MDRFPSVDDYKERSLNAEPDELLTASIEYIEKKKRYRRKKRYLNCGRKKLPDGMKKVQLQLYIPRAICTAKGGPKAMQAYLTKLILNNVNNILQL